MCRVDTMGWVELKQKWAETEYGWGQYGNGDSITELATNTHARTASAKSDRHYKEIPCDKDKGDKL